MKNYSKIISSLLMIPAFLLTMCISGCKKDSADKSDTFKVKYEISPMNNYVTKFTYTDASQKTVELTKLSDFANGIKTIKVNTRPFSAKFIIEVNNGSMSTLAFNLLILVDDETKKSVSVIVPYMDASVGTAEYVVN